MIQSDSMPGPTGMFDCASTVQPRIAFDASELEYVRYGLGTVD